MISQKKLLLLISLFSIIYILFQFVFIFPDLKNSWDVAQRFGQNDAIMQAFIKTFGGMVIQLFFFGSIALWSFNEAFEKDSKTESTTLHDIIDKNTPTESIRENAKHPEVKVNYGKIMKIVGIICLVCSMTVLGLSVFLMFYFIGEYDPTSLYFRLFLFAALAILGVYLWNKGKEEK